MSDSAQVIYDSGGVKAIYQPAKSDYLVFSFNGMGFTDSGEAFFGARFFASRRIAAVGVVDMRSTWYRDPHVAEAIAAVAAFEPLRNGQRRLTYGASMGGYGALKYGRALDAHAAIAVGPQTSIDPSRVGSFDRRYQRFFDAGLHQRMDIAAADLCPHNFVFFDPASPLDRRHVAMLPKARKLHPITSPFIGHPGMVFFTQLRLIERILKLAAERVPDPRGLRQLIRARRRKSAEYWFNRAEFMRKHQPALPDRAPFFGYREALRLNYSPAEHGETLKLMAGYADALLDAGRRAEAEPVLDTLAEMREARPQRPGAARAADERQTVRKGASRGRRSGNDGDAGPGGAAGTRQAADAVWRSAGR